MNFNDFRSKSRVERPVEPCGKLHMWDTRKCKDCTILELERKVAQLQAELDAMHKGLIAILKGGM